MATQPDLGVTHIYRTAELFVSAKGEMVAIDVFDSGNWNATTLDRNQARNLAAHLLAWCADDGDGGSNG